MFDEVISLLRIRLPECPYPLLLSTVKKVYREMEGERIVNPEDFPLALEYGCLSRLYRQPSTRWYNPGEASSCQLQYLTERHKAKVKESMASEDYTGSFQVPGF